MFESSLLGVRDPHSLAHSYTFLVYLLDGPKNHLSESAVKWFTDYLLTLKHQTVLCVSHDSAFPENVCSDVIHYEQRDVWGPYRKLVHYKGKMSDFVKLQPQAKHYLNSPRRTISNSIFRAGTFGRNQDFDAKVSGYGKCGLSLSCRHAVRIS